MAIDHIDLKRGRAAYSIVLVLSLAYLDDCGKLLFFMDSFKPITPNQCS